MTDIETAKSKLSALRSILNPGTEKKGTAESGKKESEVSPEARALLSRDKSGKGKAQTPPPPPIKTAKSVEEKEKVARKSISLTSLIKEGQEEKKAKEKEKAEKEEKARKGIAERRGSGIDGTERRKTSSPVNAGTPSPKRQSKLDKFVTSTNRAAPSDPLSSKLDDISQKLAKRKSNEDPADGAKKPRKDSLTAASDNDSSRPIRSSRIKRALEEKTEKEDRRKSDEKAKAKKEDTKPKVN